MTTDEDEPESDPSADDEIPPYPAELQSEMEDVMGSTSDSMSTDVDSESAVLVSSDSDAPTLQLEATVAMSSEPAPVALVAMP